MFTSSTRRTSEMPLSKLMTSRPRIKAEIRNNVSLVTEYRRQMCCQEATDQCSETNSETGNRFENGDILCPLLRGYCHHQVKYAR